MSKAEELSIQIVDFLDNNDLSKRNIEKWVEDRIKAYADQEVKATPYCGYCGGKKEGILETDINSKKICKNVLCKQTN